MKWHGNDFTSKAGLVTDSVKQPPAWNLHPQWLALLGNILYTERTFATQHL